MDSFSLAWAVQPLALEADKDDFRQSLVVWPTPLQNMHKLLSKQCCHSCGVSFLSLPSFSGREVELLEDDCSLPDLLPLFWLLLFFLELFRLLFPEAGFLPFLSDLSESGLLLSGLFLLDQDFSQCRSQCWELMECARAFMASRVRGLPCWPIISLICSTKPE